jgi:hypothetical protein
MAQLIDICNRALALIAAGQIADLAEGSIEAREAARFAPSLLAELADWADWPFARARVVLAQVANDRPAEWLYAYALPTAMARPIAVRAVEADAASLPLGGPFPFPVQDALPSPSCARAGGSTPMWRRPPSSMCAAIWARRSCRRWWRARSSWSWPRGWRSR